MREEIIRALRKFRSPSKVSRTTGYDIRIILPINDELNGTPRTVRQEQFGGFGRPELTDFIVGRKRAHETWDNTAPTIAEAREAYEAGTHDMVTGRDGDWLILYSIPQRRVTPRPDYFRPEI
jgi:hypothetical protein